MMSYLVVLLCSCICRDPSVLHERVLSVVRLLGPRHWASWRLLLLGVELHCGALEEASIRAQVSGVVLLIVLLLMVIWDQDKGILRGLVGVGFALVASVHGISMASLVCGCMRFL